MPDEPQLPATFRPTPTVRTALEVANSRELAFAEKTTFLELAAKEDEFRLEAQKNLTVAQHLRLYTAAFGAVAGLLYAVTAGGLWAAFAAGIAPWLPLVAIAGIVFGVLSFVCYQISTTLNHKVLALGFRGAVAKLEEARFLYMNNSIGIQQYVEVNKQAEDLINQSYAVMQDGLPQTHKFVKALTGENTENKSEKKIEQEQESDAEQMRKAAREAERRLMTGEPSHSRHDERPDII